MTNRATVLCVDDELNSLEGRKMLLESRDYNVFIASSGAEALQLFSLRSIDVVLLDYHMPEMDGNVVAEHMKARQPNIPIIMLSGDDDLSQSALRSVDAFVSKSEPFTRLFETIESMVKMPPEFIPEPETAA